MAKKKDTRTEKEKNEDAMRAASRAMLTAKPKPRSRENVQRLTSAGLWVKPFHSDALGVAPDQVEEARAALREQGVMADFDEQGRCIVTSDKQYREVAKACGLWTGRDGYAPRDEDGNRILTGRGQGQAMEEVKAELRRIIEEGE